MHQLKTASVLIVPSYHLEDALKYWYVIMWEKSHMNSTIDDFLKFGCEVYNDGLSFKKIISSSLQDISSLILKV